jgi:hypothetical protein
MYFDLLIMLAFAVAYYRIGEHEYRKGFLLGTISIFVWIVTRFVLHGGLIVGIGAQVSIFAILTIINMFRGPGLK